MKISHITLGFAISLTSLVALAQTPQVTSADATSITTAINSSGVITVTHPAQLEQRLIKVSEVSDSVVANPIDAKAGKVRKMGGYRVQIYSDNNARTAKNEARSKERAVASQFPDLATYVVYDSPYWRLRVGDCKSRAEADELAAQLRKAFPAYGSEITVVRDRINAVN